MRPPALMEWCIYNEDTLRRGVVQRLLPPQNISPQVPPKRITFLNQTHFPLPLPFLDLLFALNRRLHRYMGFKIDEVKNLVTSGESLFVVFVLPDALDQVARYPDVERAVVPACHDVDERVFLVHVCKNAGGGAGLRVIEGEKSARPDETLSAFFVIPAQAGIQTAKYGLQRVSLQTPVSSLDPDLRRGDGAGRIQTDKIQAGYALGRKSRYLPTTLHRRSQ